jgi:zinc protease
LLAGASVAQAQFPTEPPPAMELRPLQFPPFQEATLDNGLTLLVVENHRLPVVSIRLSMLAGSRSDPAGLEGVADMTAELLTKGTERRSAEQIAEEIEGVGARLFANAGNDFFSVGTSVLTEHVELAFDLVSDVLLNATYPDEELELARKRALSGLKLEKSNPGALASRYFMRSLYGDHPYGRSATEESVENITREAVQQYAATYLKPGGGLLVLSGDISLDEGKKLAERFLGSWSGRPPAADYPAPPPARETSILLVHRPGSAQSNIRVGNLALRPGDDTYYPMVVANKILGGGTDARLFMILLEQKSWTYGA